MPNVVKRVGLLATGSEIVNGEILNTNGQTMAQIMQAHGIHVGEHLVCDDDIANLAASFEFLRARHDAIITTGGLGPTSDDCTRNIVAEALGKPLVYDDASWQHIVTRVRKRTGKDYVPPSNKRQAYFPEGSEVIINPNGSANACALSAQGKDVFLLPGPPKECLPLFEEHVLPTLLAKGYGSTSKLFRWKLTGVPEAAIGETLDELGETLNVKFAYRASSPFIHVKLWLPEDLANLQEVLAAVEACVAPYLVLEDDD